MIRSYLDIYHNNEILTSFEIGPEGNYDIRYLKVEICFRTENYDEQRLFYKEEELDDDILLKNFLYLGDKSFDLYVGPKNGILVDVLDTITGKYLWHSFNPNVKIKSIKEQICLYDFYPSEIQNLCYLHKELDNDKTLNYYGINKKSTLKLSLNLKNGNYIIIKRESKKLIIDVSLDATILDIKKLIQKKVNLPIDRMMLKFNSEYLSDNSLTLKSYDIHQGSMVEAKLNPYFQNGFIIYIITMTGKKTPLLNDSSCTIKEMKELYYDKIYGEAPPVKLQRMIFAGKELENSRTVGEYGIKERNKIYMLLRLRG